MFEWLNNMSECLTGWIRVLGIENEILDKGVIMTRHGKDAGNRKAKWTWNILKYK